MDFATVSKAVATWLDGYGVQLLITAVVIVLYFLLDRFSKPKLEEGADQSRLNEEAASDAIRAARLITGFVGVLVLGMVWGVDFHAVLLFAGTTLTLLGVALFAQWSILSNITAYFILFLQPSFRRGNFIRVIDVDNYIEGYISDITLFNTKLITENREIIVYPNNLLLGRAALINPRDRLDGIGKLQQRSVTPNVDSQPKN